MVNTKSIAVSRARRPLIVIGAYALVCLIWGTTWISIKYAVTDMPPTLAAGLRFLVAAPILLALCRMMKVPVRLPRQLVPFGVFVSLGYFSVPYLLLNVGEQQISSGLTAICFSSISVLIVLLSVPVLGARLRAGQVIGVLVAFAALVALVVSVQEVSLRSPWGVVAVLTAAFLHSFSYVWIKRLGSELHVLTLNTLPMAVAGVLLTVLGVTTRPIEASMFTNRSVLATVYLGVVASALCFLVYFWLLQRLSAVIMSFIFVIFPVLAQVIGVLFEGTSLGWDGFVLSLVVLAAFAWTLLGQRPTRPETGVGPGSEAHPGTELSLGADPPGVSGAVPTPDQLDEIYAAAVTAYPAESCGFVRASGVRVCTNAIDELRRVRGDEFTRTTETGYAFAARDLLELARSIDSDDPVVVIFHSHPDAGAYMSDEDQLHAVVDGMPAYPVDHLVVDATPGGVRGARKFRFATETASYVESVCYGNPEPSDGRPPRRTLAPTSAEER